MVGFTAGKVFFRTLFVNGAMKLVKCCPCLCEETVFASLEKDDQMGTEDIVHPQNNQQNSTSVIAPLTLQGNACTVYCLPGK